VDGLPRSGMQRLYARRIRRPASGHRFGVIHDLLAKLVGKERYGRRSEHGDARTQRVMILSLFDERACVAARCSAQGDTPNRNIATAGSRILVAAKQRRPRVPRCPAATPFSFVPMKLSARDARQTWTWGDYCYHRSTIAPADIRHAVNSAAPCNMISVNRLTSEMKGRHTAGTSHIVRKIRDWPRSADSSRTRLRRSKAIEGLWLAPLWLGWQNHHRPVLLAWLPAVDLPIWLR